MAENAHAHAHPNYVKVWAILLVLLVISILGPLAGIKALTLVTAFGIAVVKAYLVVRNFMHINVEPRYVAYLLLTALGFMALLVFFVSPDVLRHEGQRWQNLAAKQSVEEGIAGPEEPFNAAETYGIVCANCHGAAGKGDGPAAASLQPKPANFTDPTFWAERDKEAVMKAIREGGAAVGKSAAMAPYGGTYDDKKIAALADYLETLKVGDAPAAPAGDAPAGEAPAGEAPAGEAPAGEAPAGEAPAGDAPAGDAPAGEAPEAPAGEAPAGEAPEAPAGEAPAGDSPAKPSEGGQ